MTRARWRRGWDSNPRLSFPNTRFPSVLLKPLGHLSVLKRLRWTGLQKTNKITTTQQTLAVLKYRAHSFKPIILPSRSELFCRRFAIVK